MTKALPRSIAFISALVLALPALAFAREGRLIGKVVDPQGKPIAGVTVTATSKDIAGWEKVLTTDGKGLFVLDFDQINVNYHYQFEKAGYATLQLDQKWTLPETERQEFKMQPATGGAGAASELPPPSTSAPAITAFNEGVAAFKARDSKTAIARFEEAVRQDPKLRQAWSALALAYLEQKQYQQAADAAEKAVALGANDQSLLRARWEAYRSLGDAARTQSAREALEKGGQLQDEAKRIYNEGVSLTKLGEDKEAYAKYQQAVEADPNFQQAWLALAVSGLKTGRPADAAAAAGKLLEIDPQNQEAIRIRYNAALQAGDEDRIADALVSLAAVDRATASDNLFKLGAKAFDAEQTAKAKERFLKVLEIDPDHPRSNYYLGVLYVREGNKKAARTHLERFVKLAPADPDAETAKGLLAYLTK